MADKIIADGGGLRANAGKLRWSLLPMDAIEYLIRVFEHGAKKYAPRNWERGQAWSTPYDSLQRHLKAWWLGEDYDTGTPEEPGSGLYHLAHVVWNALALLTFQLRGIGEDDRPVTQKVSPVVAPHQHGIPLIDFEEIAGHQVVLDDSIPVNEIHFVDKPVTTKLPIPLEWMKPAFSADADERRGPGGDGEPILEHIKNSPEAAQAHAIAQRYRAALYGDEDSEDVE